MLPLGNEFVFFSALYFLRLPFIRQAEVVYQFQGIEYRTKVLMSGYESVGEVIHIAVAKNNKDIVIRCDFMKIEKWTFIFCLLVFIATNILKQVKRFIL